MAPLGLQPNRDFFWRWLHNFATDAGVVIVGLHLALHWKWIVNALKRYIVLPIAHLGQQSQPAVAPIAVNDQEGR